MAHQFCQRPTLDFPHATFAEAQQEGRFPLRQWPRLGAGNSMLAPDADCRLAGHRAQRLALLPGLDFPLLREGEGLLAVSQPRAAPNLATGFWPGERGHVNPASRWAAHGRFEHFDGARATIGREQPTDDVFCRHNPNYAGCRSVLVPTTASK
jgi:hypothetical protein